MSSSESLHVSILSSVSSDPPPSLSHPPIHIPAGSGGDSAPLVILSSPTVSLSTSLLEDVAAENENLEGEVDSLAAMITTLTQQVKQEQEHAARLAGKVDAKPTSVTSWKQAYETQQTKMT
uniref:Uncharacterized protein n=1 Tax=Sexangularia sp. CB-2014 TaxID=1486929 RepID=A0A7S1VW10_9EUKA